MEYAIQTKTLKEIREDDMKKDNTKKGNRKKIIYSIITAVVVVIAAYTTVSAQGGVKQVTTDDVGIKNLVNSVDVSGPVESVNKMNVYSNKQMAAKQVLVRKGDIVKKGDILAVLDADELDKNISKAKAGVNSSNESIAEAKRANQSAVENANNNLKLAEIDLQQKQHAYETSKTLCDAGALPINDLNTAKAAFDLSRANYESARKALSQAQGNSTLTSELSKTSAEADLAILQRQATDTNITAPIDGTVTDVNLEVGQMPTGLAFVIEDMENLAVKTYIKEYNLSNVKLGQSAIIKTDATGDREYRGEVSYIASTSRKDTENSNNVDFETKLSILDADSSLRIGMNARINIILDKKDGVLSVPYDYIGKDENGKSIVCVIENGIVKAIPVEIGIESDVYVEISGEGIYEGLKVITTPNDVKTGEKVTGK
ncbi:RND transporter [Clostridia bacterium]|nr:RND transporter [Clostridia bacterium]